MELTERLFGVGGRDAELGHRERQLTGQGVPVGQVVARGQPGGFTEPEAARVLAQLRAAHTDALEAVALRRESRSHEDAVTRYELANSLLLLSIVSALQNQREAAVALLTEALDEARPLAPSPAVNALRSRAAAHAGRLNVT